MQYRKINYNVGTMCNKEIYIYIERNNTITILHIYIYMGAARFPGPHICMICTFGLSS